MPPGSNFPLLVSTYVWRKKVYSKQSRIFAQNTSFAEKDLGVLQGREIGCDSAMCSCGKESQWYPGLLQESHDQQVRRDINKLKLVHQGVKKRFKGLEHHFYDDRLRDLGMFILEKTRQRRGKRTTLEEAAFSGLLIKFTDLHYLLSACVMQQKICTLFDFVGQL